MGIAMGDMATGWIVMSAAAEDGIIVLEIRFGHLISFGHELRLSIHFFPI